MMCVAASLYLFTIIEKLAGNVKQFIRAVSDIVTVRCCSLVVRVVKYMRQNACTLAFCVQKRLLFTPSLHKIVSELAGA